MRLLSKLLFLSVIVSGAQSVSANKYQERSWESWGRKVAYQCGIDLSLDWDTDSLEKNVQAIKRGQNHGERACNEPLRYLWYTCQTSSGKKKVKKKKIKKIACVGTAAKTGKLSVKKGVITVSVANDESKPYKRSAKQYAKAMSVKLKMEADPYRDREWTGLPRKPNPVTDVRTYCVLNGKKIDFEESAVRKLDRKKGGVVKCWKNGKPYTDVVVREGKKTGFDYRLSGDDLNRTEHLDGELHGEQNTVISGKTSYVKFYDRGREIWEKEFHPNSDQLKLYERDFAPPGQRPDEAAVFYNKDGKLSGISCHPQAASDPAFRKLCGFDKVSNVTTYDYNGKPNGQFTFKDGVSEGDQVEKRNGLTSTVKRKGGKKDGVETFKNKDGKVMRRLTWKDGKREGKEAIYAEKEDKIVEMYLWKNSKRISGDGFYLNGKKRRHIDYFARSERKVIDYYDNGRVRDTGLYVLCGKGYWVHHCRDGEHKTYYENGKLRSVGSFSKGNRLGVHKSYYESGKPEGTATFKDDRLAALKLYDEKGKKELDEEYEADGSRK